MRANRFRSFSGWKVHKYLVESSVMVLPVVRRAPSANTSVTIFPCMPSLVPAQMSPFLSVIMKISSF